MIEYFLYSVGIIVSIFIGLAINQRHEKAVDFVINSFVAMVFANSHVRPGYDPDMPLFQILAFGVVGIGGMVGGVIGILLPKISSGFSAGFLSALFLCAMLFPMDNALKNTFASTTAIFLVMFVAWSCLSQVYSSFTHFFRVAFGTGFILTICIDGLIGTGLEAAISNLIRMEYKKLQCKYSCAITPMLVTWVTSSVIVAIIQSYRRGHLKDLFVRRGHHHYRSISASIKSPNTTPSASQKQKTFSYPDTLVTNFYDPDHPPPFVSAYAHIVIPIVQRVAILHGFQVDNSRNQAEHIIMLLSNDSAPSEKSMLGTVARLHARLLENYRTWCSRMNVEPLSCYAQNSTNKDLLLLEDVVVYFLIWGEAANLRHCPESLCFLYHKVMDEQVIYSTYGANHVPQEATRYPGYFLDMVIIPMYDVIAAGMKKGHDHHERKTYDDFNEFFWSKNCLEYSIYDEDLAFESLNQTENLGTVYEERERPDFIHISTGLQSATKTYVEKRSWLHPLFSLRRIFEWHLISFTLLATWAFSSELKWTYAYTLQVGSFIFLEISFSNMIWIGLEVWTLYVSPNQSSIPMSSVFGYLIRLMAGYLVLVYQSMYYHWSFVLDSGFINKELDNNDAHSDEPMFWWWQFAWISLISLFFYILESFICWFPSITSAILSWKSELAQAVLNICYPFSQLYYGKNVHVSQGKVFGYILYWLPLVLFKFWFGYKYIVHPVTIPTIELYDDYMNLQRISFVKTSVLMFLWWFPHFLVYLIDLSIWYSVWSSVAGGFVALSERQGAVRDNRSFRNHFIRAPLAFSQRILDEDSIVSQKSALINASTASFKHLEVISSYSGEQTYKQGPPAAVAGLAAINNASTSKNSRAKSVADISSIGYQSSNIHSSYQSPPRDAKIVPPSEETNAAPIRATTDAVGEFLSQISNQRWILFAQVWNEIIQNLREGDHLSNTERDRMLFSKFEWLSKPVYLPVFQTAGCVLSLLHRYRESSAEYSSESEPEKKIAVIEKFQDNIDVTTYEAGSEAWELASWLIVRILGVFHARDLESLFHKFNHMKRSNNFFGHINPDGIAGLVGNMLNLVNILRSSLKARIRAQIVTPEVLKRDEEIKQQKALAGQLQDGKGYISPTTTTAKIKKSVSSGFLQGLDLQNQSGPSRKKNDKKFTQLQPFRETAFVLVDTVRDKVREEMRGIIQGLKSVIVANENVAYWSKEDIGKLTFILSFEPGFFWNDVYASQQLDELALDIRSMKSVLKLYDLLALRQADANPSSPEARRRLNFFINSLFMNMPRPPPIKQSREYTCMTPYYSEDVLLSRGDLEAKNSDGISTLLYLQTLYNQDWQNFLERLNIKDEQVIWSVEHSYNTRMWASLRSQTLFRTVEGMMASDAAIRLLAEIEKIDNSEIETIVQLKFNYVVACQVYGQMKKNLESKADDIDFLLKRHPNLRVAYIDSIRSNRNGEDGFNITDTHYYSVLIKYDSQDTKVKEVFRVKLPGNPVLGEGKPENQNHAIIFSRGRYLQAIDMNQEGYFEEALKMRNLLQEFDISGCTILGFREHIFTGSVSSVANYMALQELSFVSLGQRVLNNPLCIRQHYGHPDCFDKLFVMTEGGMSKASKGINLSEDVFAGFNATIRGRSVNYKEYIQVGKGRDVGLQQTYKFEAKLSQGNAEQSISRDLDRICDRLDFFRLLSFYYGGIGHYVSNTLVMFTLVVVVYTMLILAVYSEEGVNGRAILSEGVFQLVLAGMGVLQTFPLAVTLTVEKGFISAFGELVYMMMSGGPLYFIFHIQTKCYYFQQTLLAGGATYRPTGRGFVIRHSPFDENYRFFATSHIYLGFELAINLILLAMYTKSKQYGGLTWSLWMAVVSFLLGPFWFNPASFQWERLSEDYSLWIRWMTETGGGSSEQSWEAWWKEENTFFKKLSTSWKLLLIVQKCGAWTVIGIGLFGFRFWRSRDDQMKVLEVLLLYIAYFFGNWVIAQQERRLSYAVRRFTSLLLSFVVLAVTVYLFCLHTIYIRYTIAIYFFGASIAFVSLLFIGVSSVSYAYKLHDYLVGHALFACIGILTILQLGYLQTWLLYHNALSSGVAIDDVLKYAKKTKEKALDEREFILSLQKKLSEQEKKIQSLLATADEAGVELREKATLLGPKDGAGKRGYGAVGESSPPPVSVTITSNVSTAAADAAIAALQGSGKLPVGEPPSSLSSSSHSVQRNQSRQNASPSKLPPLYPEPSTKSATTVTTPATLPELSHADTKRAHFSTADLVHESRNSVHAAFSHTPPNFHERRPSASVLSPHNSIPKVPSTANSSSSWESSSTSKDNSSKPAQATAADFVFTQPEKFPKRDQPK